MKVLTILCQKGGVGKTTFVVNLGKLLSHKGHKTLLIDTDPQGNVSTYLNFDKNSKEKIEKSVRNIPNVKVTDVNHFSAYDIIKFKKVVFTESSVKELEKRYS